MADPVVLPTLAQAFVGGGFQTGNNILQMFMTWYGLKKQAEENEKLNRLALGESQADRDERARTSRASLGLQSRQMDIGEEQFGKTMDWQKERFGEEMGFSKEKFAYTKEQDELTEKNRLEAQNYQRGMDLVKRMTNLINSKSDLRTRLINAQKARVV